MLKSRLLQWVTSASRVFVWALLRIIPPRPHAVVFGWPDNEGNTVEIVRSLVRRYHGRVYWLLDDPAYRGPMFAAKELAASERLVSVSKGSIRAFALSIAAELTFFTHGLYTAVNPPRNRLVVNVWHGDGPKRLYQTNLVRSTVLVSGSLMWSKYKAEVFGTPPGSLALVGNPRSDQFWEHLPETAVCRLGLTEGRPRVLWLPTYREAQGPRSRRWSDGEQLSESEPVDRLTHAMVHAAELHGLDLVVKPHPLDLDTYRNTGVRVLRNEDLDAAGVSLYQLIGHSDALVSDISSVWVDYLMLDRPIGFLMPDLEELKERRGLNVENLEDLLPGMRIDSAEGAAAFLAGVAARSVDLRPSAFDSVAEIGVPGGPGITERLIDWLGDYQRAKGRRRLFDGRDAAGSVNAHS
ncbi:MAG TPA: CDP-glycerol glycerophosphotransferase family protein [Nakamurella sp.]|nr:CDP-glycerol glycerophosphotransferase family protein [Nakamurella sp.]